MGFFSRLTGAAVVVIVAATGYQYLKTHNVSPEVNALPLLELPHLSLPHLVLPVAGGLDAGATEHFSPAENLERLETSELRAAAQKDRQSNRSLDVAMYAFTSREVAQLLIEVADQGTVLRIYRDGEEYENEERNATRFGESSTTRMFRIHKNIHVRVKPASRSDLMHLKAWSDGHVLREGSANWSPAALLRQDNNIRFTTNPAEIRAFTTIFESIWNRPENTVIQ
jgi:phosphatidylserine/phosphatidylglycerophosphate/cardiolipin synthase-like enzyme